jgi:ribosomal protein S18 acetylase RimI-like enzyme
LNSIFYSKGLNDKLRAEIRALDSICSKKEPLSMKLNWDMLDTRPNDEVNDLLWYEDGRLAGFLGLYCIGETPEEIEITGMVHPDYRRRGIFSKLFAEAVTLSKTRGGGRILLIAERQSDSGAGFAKNAGLPYDFSEYRMICKAYKASKAAEENLSLRPARTGDIAFLQNLDEICFGDTFPGGYARELDHLWVAVQDGRDIGKIGLNYEDGMGYVFGVCILPEFRGRGHGRAMLNAILKKHYSACSTPAILEVAVKNDSALTLYKSCGFTELTIYDYYERQGDGSSV